MSGTDANDLQALASSLVEAAKRAGERRGLYGAEAGIELRRVRPEFNPERFGVGSVREFIEKCVPELRIIAKSGSDFIYGLREWVSPPVRERPPRIDEDERALAWKVWVSPSSQFSIAVAKNGAGIRPILKGQKTDQEVEIEPARSEVHRRIAREFLVAEAESLGAVRADLDRIVDNPNSSWWPNWTQQIRAVSRDLSRRWFDYRRAALEQELVQQMTRAGIDEQTAKKVLDAIGGAREAWHRAKASAMPAAQASLPARGPVEPLSAQVDAVSLVHDLTSRMAERELRSLSLLLGLMLDAIIDRERR
ncbi:MAG: hypothetical protein ABSF85_12385 [Terriglobales bacterium]